MLEMGTITLWAASLSFLVKSMWVIEIRNLGLLSPLQLSSESFSMVAFETSILSLLKSYMSCWGTGKRHICQIPIYVMQYW